MDIKVRLYEGVRIPENRLQIESGLTVDAWSIAQASLKHMLTQDDDGLWFSPDVDAEVEKIQEKQASAREKARKAAQKRWSVVRGTPGSGNAPSNAPSIPLSIARSNASSLPSFKGLKTTTAPPSTTFQGEGDARRIAPPFPHPPDAVSEPPSEPSNVVAGAPSPQLVLTGERAAKQSKVKQKWPTMASASRHNGVAAAIPQREQGGSKAPHGSVSHKPVRRVAAKVRSDARFEGFKGMLQAFHRQVSGDTELGGAWSKETGLALHRFLDAHAGVTLEGFKVRLKHYAEAVAICRQTPCKGHVNAHESLVDVLKRLHKYAEGPVNTFGEPLGVDLRPEKPRPAQPGYYEPGSAADLERERRMEAQTQELLDLCNRERAAAGLPPHSSIEEAQDAFEAERRSRPIAAHA